MFGLSGHSPAPNPSKFGLIIPALQFPKHTLLFCCVTGGRHFFSPQSPRRSGLYLCEFGRLAWCQALPPSIRTNGEPVSFLIIAEGLPDAGRWPRRTRRCAHHDRGPCAAGPITSFAFPG